MTLGTANALMCSVRLHLPGKCFLDTFDWPCTQLPRRLLSCSTWDCTGQTTVWTLWKKKTKPLARIPTELQSFYSRPYTEYFKRGGSRGKFLLLLPSISPIYMCVLSDYVTSSGNFYIVGKFEYLCNFRSPQKWTLSLSISGGNCPTMYGPGLMPPIIPRDCFVNSKLFSWMRWKDCWFGYFDHHLVRR